MKNCFATLGMLALALLLWTQPCRAATVEDWGTVATPITSEVSFSFAQYDINNNFTDQYNFSLEGGAGATYNVSFNFDACRNGCGNPDLTYGIYDRNGSLVATTTGTVTLSAGAYTFQVKGIGMGSGNTVDYFGSVTFTAVGATSTSISGSTMDGTLAMVSPAPEPSSLALSLLGLSMLAWSVRRRSAPGSQWSPA